MIYRQKFKRAGKKGGYAFIAGCGALGAAAACNALDAHGLITAAFALFGSLVAPSGLMLALVGREFIAVETDPENVALRAMLADWDRPAP